MKIKNNLYAGNGIIKAKNNIVLIAVTTATSEK